MVETYFERRSKHTSSDGQKIPQERLKNISSMVATHLEPGWNEPRAHSKHNSSTVETNFARRLKHTTSDGRKKTRARSKHISSFFENFLEQIRNKPRATVEIYLVHIRNITRARSNHTSSTVESPFEHGRNKPRARSKHTSYIVETYLSTVETYLERRPKHESCTVETYFEHG